MKQTVQLWRIARPTLRVLTLALALVFAGTAGTRAQVSVPCPQNIDFSFGNFNRWNCYTWVMNPQPYSWPAITTSIPWTLSGPVGGTAPTGTPSTFGSGASRHALTSGTGTDAYGGFPEVAPGGGLFSLRIGNEETGYGAEMVRYYIHVPVGFNNYSFNFKYAVVFQNPAGHSSVEQPRFLVNGYDSATNAPLNQCATQTFVANDPNLAALGFQVSSTYTAEQVLYLPWTVGNLNLSGYGGRTVCVEVITADCALGGHFGYGYFDVISCGQFNAAITYCDLDKGLLTLSGPPGYQKYEWFNQTFTTRLNGAPYNTQTINVPPPATPQYYNLVLTPYSSNGCPDTIRTRQLVNFNIDAKPDSVCNTLGKPIQLDVSVIGGWPAGYNYDTTWTGDTTLSCYKCGNPVASPISSGYYVVTIKDSNSCFRQDTVKVENPNFHLDLGPDLTTCLGTPVNLHPTITSPGAAGYVFTWIPGAGMSDPTIIDPTYTPAAVGSQQFVLRVDSGICATADTMNIITLPNTFDVKDTAVCQGAQITPFVSGVTDFTYTWTYTGPPVGPGQKVLDFHTPPTPQAPTFNADTTRTFTITARYPTCPDMVKQLTVRVEPIPTVDLGDDTVFKCPYQPVYLTANVGPSWFSNYSYTWKPNIFIDRPTSPIITYTGDEDSTLMVLVRTPLGCANIDSARIHVFPGNFGTLSPIDPELCPRNAVTLTAGGGAKYQWSPALYLSNDNTAVVSSEPVTTTTYNVYITDKHGCVDTLHTTVTIHPDGTVVLPDTVVLYPGESYQLSPQGNLLYYSWFPTVGLSPNAAVSNPVAAPTVNTRYYLTGTTEAGCEATDSVYFLVREESAIGMANAFTPGSEANSVYKVSHLGTAALRSFRIYDRWGVKVFETSNINEGWDGTFNGTPQPMGVYIYTVEAQSNTGKPFIKQGNVTLLR